MCFLSVGCRVQSAQRSRKRECKERKQKHNSAIFDFFGVNVKMHPPHTAKQAVARTWLSVRNVGWTQTHARTVTHTQNWQAFCAHKMSLQHLWCHGEEQHQYERRPTPSFVVRYHASWFVNHCLCQQKEFSTIQTSYSQTAAIQAACMHSISKWTLKFPREGDVFNRIFFRLECTSHLQWWRQRFVEGARQSAGVLAATICPRCVVT